MRIEIMEDGRIFDPIPPILAAMWDIKEHPRYLGVFTRQQAPATKYPNGTRIKKVWGGEKDRTPIGTHGTVLGSIKAPGEIGYGYFIEWDNLKYAAVFCVERKIGPLEE